MSAYRNLAMHIRAATNLLFTGILLAANCAMAQDSSTPREAAPDRPKLGLVLEGGGALGLAHVGVLQWMEEHHIPVSYLAGTSMGGLVGGLYATGRSATEVREAVADLKSVSLDPRERAAVGIIASSLEPRERDFPSSSSWLSTVMGMRQTPTCSRTSRR